MLIFFAHQGKLADFKSDRLSNFMQKLFKLSSLCMARIDKV